MTDATSATARPIGQRLMDAHDAVNVLDAELYEVLCTKGGIDGSQFNDWHFDNYDLSIEFNDCKPDWRLSAEHQQVLWDAGFIKCWLNHTDGWETHYWETVAFKLVCGLGSRTFKPSKVTAVNERETLLAQRSSFEKIFTASAQEAEAATAENKRLLARIAALEAALQGMFSLAATMAYEADVGQPHPLKDGVYDKLMQKARAALSPQPEAALQPNDGE